MAKAFPRKIAIVGAGNMGNAIGALFLSRAWQVVLIDPSEEACARSRERLLGAPAGDAGASPNISWHNDLTAAQDAPLVIEAAPENLTLKQDIFRQLEACCPAGTLIATNTSGISINELAAGLAHPERFVGTHFFTPADIIPLVEVIPAEQTLPENTECVIEILESVGKLPALLRKDIPGFIANRLQHALAREAMSLLENGVATAEDIDTVARWSLGIRLALTGPLEQRDINGLDVHHAIASYLYEDLENRQTPSRVLSERVEQGHLGVKSGRGFYDWSTPERREALREKEVALRSLVAHLQDSTSKAH